MVRHSVGGGTAQASGADSAETASNRRAGLEHAQSLLFEQTPPGAGCCKLAWDGVREDAGSPDSFGHLPVPRLSGGQKDPSIVLKPGRTVLQLHN